MGFDYCIYDDTYRKGINLIISHSIKKSPPGISQNPHLGHI